MELAQEDNGDLDLNIIVNTDVRKSNANNIKRKPKKRNKYEKRREKAKRAREAAAGIVATSTLIKEQDEVMDAKESTTVSIKDNLENNASGSIIGVKEPKEEEAISTSTTDEVKVKNQEVHGSSSSSENETTNALINTLVESSLVKSSRRIHHGMNLENEQERARYMAEFHARPLEMDRRSGATAKFNASKESSHLFEQHDNENDNSPWKSLQLHDRIVNCLEQQYSKGPTVIQSRAISLLQQTQENVFIQSETGSGKTLAYLLPILQSCAIDPATGNVKREDRKVAGTKCIILCPTRELAIQISQVAESTCRSTFSFIVSGCLSGGEKRKSEKSRIRKGLTIIVATPGRLLDHLQKTECLMDSLHNNLKWLVLDEADRLLDMGLGGQVEQVVQFILSSRGTKVAPWRLVLVSATVTSRVEELANSMLGSENNKSTWKWARGTNAVEEEQSENALMDSTPRQLIQLHMTVSAKLRLTTLVAFLVQRIKNKERTVVFMSTCDSVDYHYALFQAMDCIMGKEEEEEEEEGIFGKTCPIFKLHGNVAHAERQAISKKFQSAKPALLLATDVAARGLNLPVDWILQYDAPCEVSDYIHRAGRAARAGRAGHSLLFVLPSEKPFLDVLKLRGLENMTALSLASTLNSAAAICQAMLELQGSSNRLGEAFCFELQRRLESCVLEEDAKHQEEQKALLKQQKKKRSAAKPQKTNGPLLEAAIKAYLSFVRAYPTKEKSVRHIFSARAMHLGHVARSFALKEPPKSIAGKRRDSTGQDKKRNASLAFGTDKGNSKEATKGKALKKPRLAEDHTDTKKARSMLLARAQKLQQGGMDAF